jgi:putative addiction module component (TIGR02574 family)
MLRIDEVPMTTALRDKIMALPVDEKLALVQEIWESIAKDPASLPVPEEHARLLDEREAQHASHPREIFSVEESIQFARNQIASSKKQPE